MRYIIILGQPSSRATTLDYYEDYKSFFERGVQESSNKTEVAYALFDDLHIQIGDGAMAISDNRNNRELKEYDVVFFRGQFRDRIDVPFVVSNYLLDNQKFPVNDYSAHRSSSKLSQAYVFHKLGLPTPATAYCTVTAIKNSVTQYPFILKDTYGSHGNLNFLVKSAEQLDEIAAEHPKTHFVQQTFIKNDGDYRVLLIGDETLVIKRSAASDSHLNNTSQGGSAEIIPSETFPEKIVAESRTAIKSLGMTVAGVDVLYDAATGEYYFLEINSQPQLMSGAFVDEKAALLGEFLKKIQ